MIWIVEKEKEMKKKFRVLLVMLGLIMPFMATNVYAEEDITQDVTTNDTNTEENDSEDIFTLEEIISKIPDEYTLDIKEAEATDMVWADEEHTMGWYKIDDELAKKSDEIFKTLDKNNDGIITVKEGNQEFTMHTLSISMDGFHQAHFLLGNEEKKIKITYCNTKDYNEEDAKEIQAKLSKIDLNNIIATEINSTNAPTNSGDSEEYIKKVVENGFNDDKVKVVVYSGTRSDIYNFGFARKDVLIFKNDILYAETKFNSFYMPQLTIPANINEDEYANYAMPLIKKYVDQNWSEYYNGEITSFEKVDDFGKLIKDEISTFDIGYNNVENVYKVKFANASDDFIIYLKQDGVKSVVKSVYFDEIDGVDLSGTTIDESSSIYSELKDKMQEKGYENIFGAFELKVVTGDITGGLTLTFNVGSEHNGKKAFVLHQKHDGTIEEFTGIVADGKIKVTVNELSPFMVALGDVVEEESTETVTTTSTSNNADTGTTNIFLCGTVALSAMGGMVYLKKKKQN